MPTLADILGVAPAADVIDGVSLRPLFKAPAALADRSLYFFVNETVVGVRSNDWKFVSHGYYTGSLGAFEKFDQLPGFTTSYELLFALGESGAASEIYSVADRYPTWLLE